MLTTNNFGTMITPGQRKVFYDELGKRPAQYKDVFQEVDVKDRKDLHVTHLQGFGLWEQGNEGSTIPQTAVKEDFTGSISTNRYHKGYTVSWELLQDDQTGVISGNRGIGGSAKMLARGLRGTMETVAARVLSDGFTQNGFNGKPLFATDHAFSAGSTGTGSNRMSAALNGTQLRDACRLLRAQRDNSGEMPIGAVAEKLIVHPENEFTARSIMLTQFDSMQGGEPDAAVPNLKIITLDYLTNPRDWFVQAKDIDNLFFVWREKPIFGAEKVGRAMDWFYYGYARFGAGHCDWRGIVGSRSA